MWQQHIRCYKMKIASWLVLLAMPCTIMSYKILLVPLGTGFNSRLLNMQKLADILAQDGHETTVLMNSRVRDHRITKYSKIIEFQVPEDIRDFTDIENMGEEAVSFWNINMILDEVFSMEHGFGKAMMTDSKFLDDLHNEKFDLLYGDNNAVLANVLAAHLNITTMWYMNYLFPTDIRTFYPVMPSFVCVWPGLPCTNHDMNFKNRVSNFVTLLLVNYYMNDKVTAPLIEMANAVNFTLKTSLDDAIKNKILVINSNFVLDSPLPTMPHIFPISGLFHKEPSPLDRQFLDIIESSQPHGVILLSFGTLTSKMDGEKADMFARVLGRQSQSIIWRFTDEPPKSLKANTHLVKWFPQNDLLANPAVKLFITHCGISSTFESASHGVPVLTLPLYAEQDDNANKLTIKNGMGVQLDFYTLTEEQLERGLKEVLSNPAYKENAKKTSYLLNNHLVSPQQQLRHLVNLTIETGGAHHLFHPFAVDMNWFQFHSLDVISLLFAMVLIIFMICVFSLRMVVKFIFRAICKPRKKKLA